MQKYLKYDPERFKNLKVEIKELTDIANNYTGYKFN